MALDPICGMTVDPATARSAERDGRMFYFCSEYCRQKFLAGDAAGSAKGECCGPLHQLVVLNAAASPLSAHSTAPIAASSSGGYFCPMCPGVESDKPGICPVCGMALQP